MMMIRKREEGWISNGDDRCRVSEMTRLSSSLTCELCFLQITMWSIQYEEKWKTEVHVMSQSHRSSGARRKTTHHFYTKFNKQGTQKETKQNTPRRKLCPKNLPFPTIVVTLFLLSHKLAWPEFSILLQMINKDCYLCLQSL
jgi:hypothetical protein